ncbi:MAG: transposase [Candidatus Odinarchaeota archaeon]|nr:transposase [Candidatus Odinarchaeota archaeon]
MHIRVGKENIYPLFDVTLRVVLPTIQKALEKQKQEQEQKKKTELQLEMNVEVGAKAVMDATPIKATTRDTEASYNGHYKMKCYLWHRLMDVDTGIPLGFEVTTGSIDEGHIGPALVFRARLNQVNIRDLWFDMKYAFGEALATYWIMGIETHYRISASWVVSQEYNWVALLRRYYKLWKDEEYKINASYTYILRFLALRGHLRAVGLHLRNLRIDEYLDASDSYIEVVSIRSGIEASNGYAERNSGIKGREFRGLKHVTAHIGFYELGCLILAYSRSVGDNPREDAEYLHVLSKN